MDSRRAHATAPRPPRRWGRILLVTLLVILIAVFAVVLLLWQRVAAFNDRVSSAPATSSALFGPLGGSEPVNVAFFGYAGAERGGDYLSDSISILSIDPRTDTTTVIPIPRDLWVEGRPEIPENGKINEAFRNGYEAGGLELAGETARAVLSAVTGLDIHHWLAIDFAGFRELVDAVDGVTIDNPTAFSYTTDEASFAAQRWSGSFPAGEIHLGGEEALLYTRARYTSVTTESSDFARAERQQRVLSALKSKLGDGGLSAIGPGLRLMDALEDRLQTDLSAIDLFLLSGHFDADRRIRLSEGVVLEATRNSAGQYVLVVIGRSTPDDYAPLHQYLREQLESTTAGAP